MSKAFEATIREFTTFFVSKESYAIIQKHVVKAISDVFDDRRTKSNGSGELWNRGKSELRVVPFTYSEGGRVKTNYRFRAVMTKSKSIDGALVTPIILSKEHAYTQRTPGSNGMGRPYTLPGVGAHGGNIAVPHTSSTRDRASRHRQGLTHIPMNGQAGILVRYTSGTVTGVRSETRPNGTKRTGTRLRRKWQVMYHLKESHDVKAEPWIDSVDWDGAVKRAMADITARRRKNA